MINFYSQLLAIGCPGVVPPQNAWLKKGENEITIGCHTGTEKWQMKCVGNHWIGLVGNCTQGKRLIIINNMNIVRY